VGTSSAILTAFSFSSFSRFFHKNKSRDENFIPTYLQAKKTGKLLDTVFFGQNPFSFAEWMDLHATTSLIRICLYFTLHDM